MENIAPAAIELIANHKTSLYQGPQQPLMKKKIIEVIGPPGVGKSAIYNSLCRHWSTDFNWIHQDALLAPKPSFSDFTQWVKYSAHVFLKKKLVRHIPTEYGYRFINQHPELATFCWNHLSNPVFFNAQEIAKRFRAAHLLFMDFCRYQAISESADTKPCVIDEGLLQKSFLLHDNADLMQEVIRQYLVLAPLPYAIIYLDTPDRKVITERLQTRKKVLISHQGKDEAALLEETEKWQNLLHMILEKTESAQVRIYKLDATRPIEENVNIINETLTRIG